MTAFEIVIKVLTCKKYLVILELVPVVKRTEKETEEMKFVAIFAFLLFSFGIHVTKTGIPYIFMDHLIGND